VLSIFNHAIFGSEVLLDNQGRSWESFICWSASAEGSPEAPPWMRV